MFPIQLVLVLVFVTNIYGASIKDEKNVGIVGGHKISIEMAPYMASVRLNATYHWCGGSIIHEQFILTAAHCIVPNRSYKVVVGTDKLDKGGILYDVEKIIVHDQYSSKTHDYDVCILKLNASLSFGTKVDKITLAEQGSNVGRSTKLLTSGWGFTEAKGHVSDDLMQVSINKVLKKNCQMYYLPAKQQITSRMLCAGGFGKDSCTADSGGPLIGKGIQVGITSFGSGCGTYPGVYAKVAALSPWIEENVAKNL